jgi:hypothetical protein
VVEGGGAAAEPVLAWQYARGRAERCADDAALLAALAGRRPLAEVDIPAGSAVTAAGLASFAAAAAGPQAAGPAGAVRPWLVLSAAGCEWGHGQLGALAGLALGRLDLSGATGFTAADAAAFGAGCAALQAEGVMGRALELSAARSGLGRIAALHHRPSTPYQICCHIRRLCF